MQLFKILLIALGFFVSVQTQAAVPDWGKTGHRTVGAIAQEHLTKKARRTIRKMLGSESLAMVANFADDIKSDKKYNEFYTQHYVNKPFGVLYHDAKKNHKGDLLTGIKKCIAVLSSKESTREDTVFYLKMLVHFIGDLHQPLHVGRAEDKGGNSIRLQWFYKKANLHSVWDSKMIDFYQMSYTELAENAPNLSKKQVQFLQRGSIEDWVNEGGVLAEKVYASAKKDENLTYRYMYDYFPLVRSQLQKGGVRLAKVLNDIFG